MSDASTSTNYSSVSRRLATTIKKNQHIVLSVISLCILFFSMLMILLNSLGKIDGGSDSVYFAMISNIIGLFTPMPTKNNQTTSSFPQITNETQTEPYSSNVIPPALISSRHRRRRSSYLSSSSSS